MELTLCVSLRGEASKFQPATPLEVREWLDWAGAKLLSLPKARLYPAPPGVCWPDFAPDANSAYGYTGATLRSTHPTSAEIDLMDRVLELTMLIPDPTVRRIVGARSLTHPISARPIYSFRKIALLLHSDARIVARRYVSGLAIITTQLAPSKAYAFRHFFAHI